MRRVTRVLVASDLSEHSDEAIRQAHARARANGAAFAVCHVVPDALRNDPLFPQLTAASMLDVTQLREETREELLERISDLTGRDPDEFELFLDEGTPYAAIIERAESWGADLVVVGSGGDAGLTRMLAGSVAEKVVRYAHSPVLISRTPRPSGHIIVGTDFSDPALPAVCAAADEVRRTGATATIVHCIDLDSWLAISPESVAGAAVLVHRSEIEKSTEARLEAALRQCDLVAEKRVAFGPPAAALVSMATERDADLLVIGTAGRTGLRRVLLGSVAETVVRSAPCSVLVVRLHPGS
jgi:nucleotide-binding universal stress UspA family protein